MRDEKLRGDETGVVEIRIAETGVVETRLRDGGIETRGVEAAVLRLELDNNFRRLDQF
jgi:hypothetical protein